MIDLRSDTVTRPTPGMREAMANAEVGDDVYGEDPTVNALEREVAAAFGHEAALWTPTGSMANQIGLQLLVQPGQELLCDVQAHVARYEMGAAAAYGGITTRTWPDLSVPDIEPLVSPPGGYSVPTAALAVENTHNMRGGTVLPLAQLRAMRDLADSYELGLHCDGARIWHAHVADGVAFAEYGRLFDTLSVCLSKGLGAPAGSLLLSSADNIGRARVIRKRLGGGMRQVGILAAAGRYALAHHVERLADDHAKAARLADALRPYVRGEVRTNIVVLAVPNAAELSAAAAKQGVRFGAISATAARLVTHYDVTDDDITRTIEVLTALLPG
ncbi:threonine aldolase [Actinocatenispora thailandica]|uniref:Threonine aldolase n=1 Tax=Actinocatenispora thailandica TaxID=227318 RepID=A0A7R7HYU4_9ACTN|nr:GntG family PLP-dependent aldolase [Actinocatenispora thailandica]BCJ36634.1 threonine aldolase [Actinocatenispora thailandica]